MRERVSESGIHEYCVAWRHEAGGHAGFTWESSVNLYDRGLGGIVRRFESKAALGRSPRSKRGRRRPGSAKLSPLRNSRADDERPSTADSLMSDSLGNERAALPGEHGRPMTADAVLEPLRAPAARGRSASRQSRPASRSGRKATLQPLELELDLDDDAEKSTHKSIFDAPVFDPAAVPEPKLGENGYEKIEEELTRAAARTVARVCSTSSDDLRRPMLKQQVRQFIMLKRGYDEERTAHLVSKPPGTPGSYDRYLFLRVAAATHIQAHWRCYIHRTAFKTSVAAAVNIQRIARGIEGRNRWDAELLLQRRVRWKFRMLASVLIGRRMSAWLGRLRRLTHAAAVTRTQLNREYSMSSFAENRDFQIRSRIEYLVPAIERWVSAVCACHDPSESLRADLIELGRDDDVDRYVAESDALRRILTDGESPVTAKLFRSLPTQREISGLMFHQNGQKLEWEMARRLVPPKTTDATQQALAERAYVEFLLYSSQHGESDAEGSHFLTLEILRTKGIPPTESLICEITCGDDVYEDRPSGEDSPSRDSPGEEILQWDGGKRLFKLARAPSALIAQALGRPETIQCRFMRADDRQVILGEFALKLKDLLESPTPVLRYKWLTIRRPKPKLHLKLSIDKKEAAYGHMTHWEGALTVEIMRATGVRAVDLREEGPFPLPRRVCCCAPH